MKNLIILTSLLLLTSVLNTKNNQAININNLNSSIDLLMNRQSQINTSLKILFLPFSTKFFSINISKCESFYLKVENLPFEVVPINNTQFKFVPDVNPDQYQSRFDLINKTFVLFKDSPIITQSNTEFILGHIIYEFSPIKSGTGQIRINRPLLNTFHLVTVEVDEKCDKTQAKIQTQTEEDSFFTLNEERILNLSYQIFREGNF